MLFIFAFFVLFFSFLFNLCFFFFRSKSATYTANLASLFVVQSTGPSEIKSIEEAIVKNVLPICTWAGTNSDLYVAQKYPAATRIQKRTELESFQGLETGECKLVLTSAQAWEGFKNMKEYNPNCDRKHVGQAVRNVESGIAIHVDPGILCTSLIRDVFNLIMAELIDDGFIEAAWNEYYETTKTYNCDSGNPDATAGEESGAEERQRHRQRYLMEAKKENIYHRILKGGGGGGANPAAAASGGDDEGDSLTMEQMAGTFVLHGVLSAVALVVGTISAFVNKKKGKNVHLPNEIIKDFSIKKRSHRLGDLENGPVGMKGADDNGRMVMENGGNSSDDAADDDRSHVSGASVASGVFLPGATDVPVIVQAQLQALHSSQRQLKHTNADLLRMQTEFNQQMSTVMDMLSKMQPEEFP